VNKRIFSLSDGTPDVVPLPEAYGKMAVVIRTVENLDEDVTIWMTPIQFDMICKQFQELFVDKMKHRYQLESEK
jgi:hypothetical protein